MTHLWEVKHSYYCSETHNHVNYRSLDDFLFEMGDADNDYNLLIRWDWVEGGEYGDHLVDFDGDVFYRNGELRLFFVAQRKGFLFSANISVCRVDEDRVIEYLKPHLTHLISLWNPLERV